MSPQTRAALAFGLVPLAALAIACDGDSSRHCVALFERQAYADAALHCQQVFEATGDPRSATHAARALQRLGQADEALAWVERAGEGAAAADLWRLAAAIHRQRGDSGKAVAAGRRELALRRGTGEHARAANAGYDLFYDAWAAADYRTALDFARGSLDDATRARDRALEVQALQALTMVLYEVGDFERARRMLMEATRRLPSERYADRAYLLVYEGLIRLNTGRPRLARDAFDRALAVAAQDTVPARPAFLRATHLDLVKTHLELGSVELADQHLAVAEANAEPGGSRSTALLYYRSRVLHARGHLADAGELVEAALAASPDAAWVRDLEVQRGVLAEARGDFAAAEEAYRRAVDAVDTMRGELGADELKSWLLDHRRRPFEALFLLQARGGRGHEALATAERTRARTLLDQLDATPAAAETDGHGLAAAAGRRLDTLDALLGPLRESRAVALGPLDEALAAIGDRYLLIFVEAGDELWRFTVSGGGVDLQRLAATPAAVERLVHRFLARPDDPGPASVLAGILLPPDVTADPGSPVHVAADGVLGSLPFAALRLGDRYLVELRPIAYVPSLHGLAAMLGAPPRGDEAAAVVIADPHDDLPWAALEAHQVARRLGVAPRLGDEASLAALSPGLPPRLLHVATHSGLGPGGPWLGLAEGRVSAEQLVAARLAPRLVVLATCASAARRGRGMERALGAAFLAAGSQAVLASLWSLDDRAARELVLRFYDEGGSDQPVAALARAQRGLIAAGEPPSAWAPFVVLGISRPHAEAG